MRGHLKYLVVSDIHGGDVRPIVKKAPYFDAVIFLGDGVRAVDELKMSAKKIYAVRGNCDFSDEYLVCDEIRAGSHKIFITHGHRFYVKSTTEYLIMEAQKRECDIALFGHTHTPYYAAMHGVTVCNPGAASGYEPTFGVLDVTQSGVLFCVSRLDTGETVL